MIIIQNGVPKLKFSFVTCLVCHSVLAFVFMKNSGHPNQSSFLLRSELNKTELKNLVSIKGYGSEKSIWIFYFCTKNHDVSKIMETWELIGIYFQKLSWCTTTEPNFLFVAYPSQNDGLRSTRTLKSPCLTLPVLTQDEQKT